MRSVIWGSPSVTANTTMDPTRLKWHQDFYLLKKWDVRVHIYMSNSMILQLQRNKKTRSRGAVFRKRSKNDASYWSHLRLTTAKGCPCYKYHKGATFEPLFFWGGTSGIFEVGNGSYQWLMYSLLIFITLPSPSFHICKCIVIYKPLADHCHHDLLGHVIRDGHASLHGFMWTPGIQENGACCCSSVSKSERFPIPSKKVTHGHHATLCLHDHLP